MSDFSIAQAKAQFANLVQQAEAGRAVRITRRGRSVAVVLSDAEYIRLSAQPSNQDSLFDFTSRLRQQAVQAGQELLGDEELTGLREYSERGPQTDWR